MGDYPPVVTDGPGAPETAFTGFTGGDVNVLLLTVVVLLVVGLTALVVARWGARNFR